MKIGGDEKRPYSLAERLCFPNNLRVENLLLSVESTSCQKENAIYLLIKFHETIFYNCRLCVLIQFPLVTEFGAWKFYIKLAVDTMEKNCKNRKAKINKDNANTVIQT